MPLSAAEVRRRGDRIRRRRNALVAGGAALAVAAVAVPVLALGGGSPKADKDDLVTKDPAPAGVAAANLITDDDTVYMPGAADWFTVDTSPGDGQSVFHPCARESLAGLGAESVYRRDFELRNLEPGSPDVKGDYLGEAVAEFGSEKEAEQAYQQVADWIADCRLDVYPEFRAFEPHKVTVPGADAAMVVDAHWGPVEKELDPTGDFAYINETGIAVAGDRLTVLTSVIVGQDYNFEDGTPVEKMLPAAVERLVAED